MPLAATRCQSNPALFSPSALRPPPSSLLPPPPLCRTRSLCAAAMTTRGWRLSSSGCSTSSPTPSPCSTSTSPTRPYTRPTRSVSWNSGVFCALISAQLYKITCNQAPCLHPFPSQRLLRTAFDTHTSCLDKPKARISTGDSRHFELPWLFRSPRSNKLECPEAPLSFYPGFSSVGLRPRRRASLIYGDGGKKTVQKAYFGFNYPSSRRLPLHQAS